MENGILFKAVEQCRHFLSYFSYTYIFVMLYSERERERDPPIQMGKNYPKIFFNGSLKVTYDC